MRGHDERKVTWPGKVDGPTGSVLLAVDCVIKYW